MKIKHRIIYYALCFIFILQTFLFISCKDDPVTVNPPPPDTTAIKDSTMFDWEYIPFPQYSLLDFYMVDTNKIYFVVSGGFVYYDGQNVVELNYNDPKFFPSVVKGRDANNIYIGGDDFQLPNSNTKMKKWTGSNFITINFPIDSTNNVKDLLLVNENIVWIVTDSKVVYKFDGINISSTILPLRFSFPKLFKDNFNNLYLFGSTHDSNTNNFVFYTYKLINDTTWQQIMAENGNDKSELQPYINMCGTDAIRGGISTEYKFTGTGWEPLKPAYEFTGHDFGGSSINDFLCVGFNLHFSSYYKMYYYNGSNWYRMSNYIPNGAEYPLRRIKKMYNNYYGIYSAFESYNSFFVIARPKK